MVATSTGAFEARIPAIDQDTQAHLRERDLLLARFALDHAADAIFWAGESGRFEYVNEQACAMLGHAADDLLRLSVWDTDSSITREQWKSAWAMCRTQGVLRFESTMRAKDGHAIPVELVVKHLSAPGKEFHCAYVRDLTARRLLEAQFRQAQKLEAIGRLAGAVAHDFNNLLTIINGYGDLLLERAELHDPDRSLLAEMVAAGGRATALTRQLLAFSRKQMVQPSVIDLNLLLKQMISMLKRLLGESVVINLATPDDLGRIKADPGQIEQIVMNLALNSRDAMPTGGRLTLETGNLIVADDAIPGPKRLPLGSWVALRVRDTGVGMDESVQAHLFEPFFTTKEAGKGTGLGLSTVYGIVKQAGGHIFCHSEAGRGTVFTLLFPRIDAPPAERPAPPESSNASGHETVLLVEDDANVRMLARLGLVGHGYTVLEAGLGSEALKVAKAHDFKFDLVVTDMVMPFMNGMELIRQLRCHNPGMAALLMTGYLDPGVTEADLKRQSIGFLQKPFQSRQLVARVKETLNQGQPGTIGKAA